MACEYSPGIADLIDMSWEGYNYTPDDVIDMVARISRPSKIPTSSQVTAEERDWAKELMNACD